MLGAIMGDIAGSRFEWKEWKSKEFVFLTDRNHFTDDSLMTLAIARAFVLHKNKWREADFQQKVIDSMLYIGRAFPRASWGAHFYKWLFEKAEPYQSWGNGAAMRISSIGWIAESEEDVKYFSKLVTEVSHNHPEGIKGAEAVAMAIYLARNGADMTTVRNRMIEYYPHIAAMTVDSIRPGYCIDDQGGFISCQGSVPEAIVCFLEATSTEDAIRNAISLGGDADTQAAIAGSMAEAYFGVPVELEDRVLTYLTDELRSVYYSFDLIKKPRRQRA
ncbi:MAG: ADP-ribosylglycohydrolase family protein [Clostridia bacterium]|nr:ADP-ribosylglycohydrolase family protein [Clostridia bacterium]